MAFLSYCRSLLTAIGLASIGVRVYSLQINTQSGVSAVKDEPAPAPEYEVATINPADTRGDGRRWVGFPPTGLTVKNMPVQMLIQEAFGLEEDRILGAPAWVKT